MQIIDISLPLDNNTPVYPGNVPLIVNVHHAMPEHSTRLSTITLGSHTGTHIDAPSHALLGGVTLDKILLSSFVGSCRVLDFSKYEGMSVTTAMLQSKNIKKGERILLKTRNSIRGFKEFYDDFVYLDADAADYVASTGVALVGIDSLSIKERGSSDQRAHTSLLSKNIPIVEGLDLSKVSEGEYELICLPLNFIGIDGAPARAVLVKRD